MKRNPTEQGLSFRTKLIASFVGVSVCLLTASLFFLSRFAYDLVLQKVSTDYEHTMQSAQHLLELRTQEVKEGLDLSLSDPLFRSELSRAQATGLDLGLGGSGGNSLEASHRVFSSASLPLFTRFDIFAILTADGNLIYTRQKKEAYGDDWSTIGLVKEATGGTFGLSIQDSFEGRPGPFLVVSYPVRTGDTLLGIFVIGEPLSADLIPRIEATSGATVYIDTGGERLFGLRDSIPRAEVPKLAESSGKVQVHKLRGVPNLAARMPIRNPLSSGTVAHALLIKPLESEMGSVRRGLELALLKILLLAILTSALVATVISKQVARALQMLRDGVRRVQGGDLNVELRPQSRDEFGQLTLAFNDMTAGLRQRELLKTSFEKYVASPVVEGIIRNEAPEVKSVRREITVFFSDIEGFTKLVETEDPSVLVPALNEYLAYFTDQIKQRSGTVDKFVGDAVMAIWGFGASHREDAARACEAAIRIQTRSAGKPDWVTRIGINTGEAIVGNIGSQDRLQYTAIGDSVNIAARLEALNKKFGTRILASDATYEAAKESGVIFRHLGEVLLRGKNKAVRVHEAVALADAATPSEVEFCKRFNGAVETVGARRFKQAMQEFAACRELKPEDQATQLYLAQVEAWIQEPPPSGAALYIQSD